MGLKSQLTKKNIYTKYDAGITFLLAIIIPQMIGIFFVFTLMAISFASNTEYTELIKQPLVLCIMTALSQLCFVAVFFGYNVYSKTNFIKASKLNFQFGIIPLFISLLIGIIALFGYNNLITSFDAFLKFLGHTSASMPLPLSNPWWLVINIVLLCVLPAVMEELLFRGMILNGLKQYGKWTAIFGSALLFALLHGNIDQLIYPFILGVIFALIADSTNSVIPTIIVHFVNNCIVVVINYIYIQNNTLMPVVDTKFVLLSLLFAVLTTCAIIGLVILLNYLKSIKAKNCLKNKKSNVLLGNIVVDIDKVEDSTTEIYANATSTVNDAAKTNKANYFLWIGVAIGAVIWVLSLF